MSTSGCWRRVRALQDSGVVERIGRLCILRPAVAIQAVVLDCFSTTGDADYHLRIRCRNKNVFNSFLGNFIFKIPGIATVRTKLVLREIKHTIAAPLVADQATGSSEKRRKTKASTGQNIG